MKLRTKRLIARSKTRRMFLGTQGARRDMANDIRMHRRHQGHKTTRDYFGARGTNIGRLKREYPQAFKTR